MKDKLEEMLKKVSFITNHPESDWPKLFSVLLLLGAISLGWNIYFYFSIQSDIAASEFASRSRVTANTTKEDEIQEVIGVFEDKRVKQSSLLESSVFKLEDPSVL